MDITGTWTGTEYTDGLTHAQGLIGDGNGWGGPPKTYNVTLTITSQGEYKNFTGGDWVSAVSGHLGRSADGYFLERIPISGCINYGGLIKLSYFTGSPFVDLTFNGHITRRGSYVIISGNWTQMSWSNGFFLHQYGQLSVGHYVFLVNKNSVSLFP